MPSKCPQPPPSKYYFPNFIRFRMYPIYLEQRRYMPQASTNHTLAQRAYSIISFSHCPDRNIHAITVLLQACIRREVEQPTMKVFEVNSPKIIISMPSLVHTTNVSIQGCKVSNRPRCYAKQTAVSSQQSSSNVYGAKSCQ